MKTKNVIVVVAMVLQMGIVLGSVAQKSVDVYPSNHEQKMEELIAMNPGFLKADHSNLKNDESEMNLESWMLNPEEWMDNSTDEGKLDPQVKLENWMLDPLAMASNRGILSEDSDDTIIGLETWMLDPSEMSLSQTEEKVQLEAWMLNPTKW